jgi:hypothetical protein
MEIMTQSVADKTLITAKTRRHTDPPGLWIVIITASITLHLLVLWLLRSSFANLLSQQQSSAAIPIEYVEISPKVQPKATTQPKAKPVSPPKPSTTQKSDSALPQQQTQQNFTAKPAPSTEDSNAIAFADNEKLSADRSDAKPLSQQSPQKTTVEEKTASTPKPVTTPEFTPQPKPTLPAQTFPETTQQQVPQPTLSPQPFPETTQQQVSQPTSPPETFAQQQTEPTLPPQIPESEQPAPIPSPNNTPEPTDTDIQNQANIASPEQTPSSPNTTQTDSIPQTPEPLDSPLTSATGSPIPYPEQPPGDIIVGKETSLDKKGGGIIVGTWTVEPPEAQKNPDNLAKPIGNSTEKLLNLPTLSTEDRFEPIDFQVSLIIDNQGNLVDVYLPPAIPEPQRTQYREYALLIFKDEKFVPPSGSDSGKTPVSNLVVRIKINRR